MGTVRGESEANGGESRDRDPQHPGEPSKDERVSQERFADDEAASGEFDGRAHAAWRSWLGALASDPKAALAAALAYESLPSEARDAWLEALDSDAAQVSVPKVALYAPLLAVEVDEARRARIEHILAGEVPRDASTRHALRCVTARGDVVGVVVSPLYLDFVELLVCRFDAGGVKSARHEPLCHLRESDAVPEADGSALELAPLALVVEELAHAVVADRRAGRTPAEALHRFIHLFEPALGAGADE